MPQRRMITRTLALMLPLALAAPALAAGRDPGPGHHRMGPMMGSPVVHRLMMAVHSLDLTDDQSKQLHARMEEFHAVNEAKLAQLGTAHQALADQVLAEPIDEAAIRADIGTMANVHAEIAVAEAYLVKDLRGVLTEDQRDQLDKELAKAPDDSAPPCHGAGPQDGSIPRHHGG